MNFRCKECLRLGISIPSSFFYLDKNTLKRGNNCFVTRKIGEGPKAECRYHAYHAKTIWVPQQGGKNVTFEPTFRECQ